MIIKVVRMIKFTAMVEFSNHLSANINAKATKLVLNIK